MNPSSIPMPGALRLRALHPLIDGDGSCSLIYDLERAAVLEVPAELQFHVAPALETGDWDEDLLSWLVNEDLVTAGALLHDIGKLESYTWETGVFDTTERGRLAGHVVIGAMMLREAMAGQPEPVCTPEEAMLIEHLILSHHGKLEYGSPVRPMTLEAEILHFADDASAKTAAINEAYASPEYFPGDARLSSKRLWQLDNRWLFRSDADFGLE